MKTVTVVLGFVVFALGLLVHGTAAQAIPCSPRVPGQGLAPSVACLDGAPGDSTLGDGIDYAFDLNAGAYFGFNDWSFLQLRSPRSPSDDETVVDAGLIVDAVGNSVMGSWLISPSIWADYDDLAVILKADVAGEDNIFWSTYLLQEAKSDGTWFSGRPLANFSLFGRTSQVSIPEPETWSLLLAALIALVAVSTVGRYTISPI